VELGVRSAAEKRAGLSHGLAMGMPVNMSTSETVPPTKLLTYMMRAFGATANALGASPTVAWPTI
jgi:hypothetical protein